MKDTILHTPKTLSFSQDIVKYLPPGIRRRLPAEIGIVLVSEKESRRLNRRYRKKYRPANVLSFAYGKEYGEIIVCPSLIRREAREQNHSFEYQLTRMVLHGMIHLGGVHHENSKLTAKRFLKAEEHVLKRVMSLNHES